MVRVPERSCSGVVKGSCDIFDVFSSWGYEIYVGNELCEGDVLEALGDLFLSTDTCDIRDRSWLRKRLL